MSADPALELPRPAWIRLALIALAVIAMDQLTKSWAERALDGDRIIHVIGSLQFALAYNRGVAFGAGVEVAPVLVSLAIAAGVAIVYTTREHLNGPAATGVGLVLGGALGNVIDRVLRNHGGAVVDFIDLQWWPVFNVADAAVVVGAGTLVVMGSYRRTTGSDS